MEVLDQLSIQAEEAEVEADVRDQSFPVAAAARATTKSPPPTE